MTLDEAIEKELWEETGQYNVANSFHIAHEVHLEETCKKEAEYHRQLAEWLKELKRLREQTEKRTETHACDCISRQAAKLKVARVTWDDGDSSYDFHDKCVDCLNELPPVTPQLKIGLWMECGGDEPWLKGYCCSLCNFTTTQKYDYCTCGAKMIDPQESEETDADSN